MNTIISASKAQTMTSKQIAVVVEKRHDNVKRTIENLANQGVISYPQIEDGQKAANGVVEKLYLVSERDSYIIVAQLCPEYTAKLVDYWMATKSQTPTIPQTLPEALRLAADLAEQKAKVEQQLAIAAPKADALDRIADTTGVFGIREAAKALKVKQSELVTLLIEHKWAYRDERQVLQGYSSRIDQGYIKHVMSAPIILNDGTERVFSQLKITSAGVTRLSQIISKTTKAA